MPALCLAAAALAAAALAAAALALAAALAATSAWLLVNIPAAGASPSEAMGFDSPVGHT